MTRTGMTALALTAVSSLSLATYQAGRYVSLNRGIRQTENAIQQVDKVLEQDKAETSDLLQKLARDYSFGITSLSGDPLYIAKSVTVFNEGASAFKATSAAQSGKYGEAIEQTARAIAGIWGQLDPRVKFGRALVDVAANAYQAQALLRRQAQLLETRLTLERQLSHLRAEDPNYQTDIEKILGNLQTDSDAEHQTFLRWLSEHGLSEQDVTAAALQEAIAKGPAAAGEVARGAVLLAPQNISAVETLPCMNPNFIAALQKGLDRGTLPGGFDAGVTTRHPVTGPYYSPDTGYYFLGPYSPDTYSTVPIFADAQCASAANRVSSGGESWFTEPTKEALRASLLVAANATAQEEEAALTKSDNQEFGWNCAYHVNGVELGDQYPELGPGGIGPVVYSQSKDDHRSSGSVKYHVVRSHPAASCNVEPGNCPVRAFFTFDGARWTAPVRWGGAFPCGAEDCSK